MTEINLFKMMRRLGVEPPAGAPLGLSLCSAAWRCSICPSTPACHDWLESAPDSVRLAPLFCPNNALLSELRLSAATSAAKADRPPKE
jgi:hypothetical protein